MSKVAVVTRLIAVLVAVLSLAGCRGESRAGGGVGADAGAASLLPEQPPQPVPPHAGTLTVEEEAVNRRPLRLPLKNPRILVRKAARRLELFSEGERVRVRRVALGFAPEGDKERQGDGRTPEGEFYVCVQNGRSSFHVSLGLSYPAADDAERALRDGLITRAQRDRIVRANRKRLCPPWDTRLGGEIFIHGGGTGSDWTFGCVALENEHVEELFNHVPTGTNVRIEP
jgi:hypothetical protein